ncbi:MAG: TonB family protein, partial [Rhodothermales bacterium]|nr:TonB family protein [Rhodothermales bacterium]
TVDTPPEEVRPESAAPQEARPTDVPDEVIEDEEVVSASEAETISPTTNANPDRVSTDQPTPPNRQARPTGAGVPDGTGGSSNGQEGTGTDERRTAPFQIEGLNRVPVTTPVPDYSEKVNATIKVRITVDPYGRITQRIPLMKSNPALERSVLETLSEWRFNPLPTNAPQENQVGTITFRFRLE